MTSDPTSIVLVTLLFVGLASIALAAWFIYMWQSISGGDVSAELHQSASSPDEMSPRLVSAEQTRDAQQSKIAELKSELERTHQALATVSAQAMPRYPPSASAAAAPRSASTVLEKPPLALILDVPVYKQQHSLSCESSAAAMAANYHGISVSEQDILLALPRHENPHLGFRGDVDGPHGGISDYGVYAEPIRRALARWGLQAEHLNGGPDEIREHIRMGRPVIVWITYDLQIQSPKQVIFSDGQAVTLVPYEHTVLVVGYNRDGLWVNDPYAGTQEFYPESDFVRSFAYLGNMGLIVDPPIR